MSVCVPVWTITAHRIKQVQDKTSPVATLLGPIDVGHWHQHNNFTNQRLLWRLYLELAMSSTSSSSVEAFWKGGVKQYSDRSQVQISTRVLGEPTVIVFFSRELEIYLRINLFFFLFTSWMFFHCSALVCGLFWEYFQGQAVFIHYRLTNSNYHRRWDCYQSKTLPFFHSQKPLMWTVSTFLSKCSTIDACCQPRNISRHFDHWCFWFCLGHCCFIIV